MDKRREQKDRGSESGSTIIGSSMNIKGEITGEGDVTVLGQVEGTIDFKNNNVTIGSTGRIKADINGRIITIEGEVEGNLLEEKNRPSALRESSRRYEGTGD